MATINKFEDLEIWKLSRQLNLALFKLLENHKTEDNGYLKNHILKTAGSVMDNIAEGFEREGRKEFIHFLSIAKASAGELNSQILRAYDFKVLVESDFKKVHGLNLILIRKISSLMQYLKGSGYSGNKFKT